MDRLTDNTRYCFMICAGAKHPIGEDCEIYNVCYERKMYEKLKHYEDLEESGRMIILSKEFNKDYLFRVLSSEECVVHFGGKEPEECNNANCEKCWKAALKAGVVDVD